MKANQLILDVAKMFNNNYVGVEVSMGYPYNNGVRSEVADSEKLTIVCPSLAFEKLTVKLPIGATSSLGEIPSGGLPVAFEGLIITPYISNGNLSLSAKANSVRLSTTAK